LAGAVSFHEKRPNVQRASDFVADDDASERGRDDAGDGVVLEDVAEGMAELFGAFRMLQNQRALEIGGAVASAGEFEVPCADSAYLFEELENFITLHRSLSGALANRKCKQPVALA
jgi:hypothetical protein